MRSATASRAVSMRIGTRLPVARRRRHTSIPSMSGMPMSRTTASGAAPDAVVLDIGMPDIDGIEVCRRLRATGNRVPILMLTARDAVADRIDGLDAGADDYLVKPFDV